MDMHDPTITAVMVFVFAAAGIFFLIADQVIRQVAFLPGIVS